MPLQILDAEKLKSKARIFIPGPSGSGKTYSALAMAKVFGKNVYVIDTENKSSGDYSHEFGYKFKIIPIEDNFHPKRYIQAMTMAYANGADVLIIDSSTHEWSGPGGILELHAIATQNSRNKGNSYTAWNDITPLHNEFLHAITHCPIHLIVTARAKTEYALEMNPATGRNEVKELGMAPIQRDGMKFEFNFAGPMDLSHNWTITKSHYSALDGLVVNKPGVEIAREILAYLNKGVDPVVDAEKRFFARFATSIGGNDWSFVQQALDNDELPKPTTVEEWDEMLLAMEGML